MGKAKIILYHGTRAPLEKIAKEGLLIRAGKVGPDTKLQMIEEVLAEFGYRLDQVPEWIWRHEYAYEATIEPHLHFSINRETAIGYSHQGCETKAQVRAAMYIWLYGEDLTSQEIREKLGESPHSLAAKKNGKISLVFCVQVLRSFIRTKDLLDLENTASKIRKLYSEAEAEDFLARTTQEMRVIQNIPPRMIKKVWRIDFQSFRDYRITEIPLSERKEV